MSDIVECLREIKRKVDGWLVPSLTGRPSRAEVAEVRALLGVLEYHCRGHYGWIERPGPSVGDPICSEPGCKAGWREGLLNYAPAGRDPVWYCLEHVKPLEHSHHVPGQPEWGQDVRLAKAREGAKAWVAFLARLEHGAGEAPHQSTQSD